jgi:DNA-binding transcriptional regulator LsrR (DeoR family)
MNDDNTASNDLILRVAWLYHVEGLTQSDIAELLEMPRSRVIKLLRDGFDSGAISIQLSDKRFNCLALEADLKRELELKDAFVMPTPQEANRLTALLGQAAANYLPKILEDGMTLGTAWGATLLEAAKHFRALERDHSAVVMMMGGITDSLPAVNPNDIARMFAARLAGRMYYLCAPVLLENPSLRDALLQDTSIKTPLALARACNVALLGAGTVTPDATLTTAGIVSGPQLAELRAKGAVGDLLARYYNAHGEPVRTEFDSRVVGLELADLRAIDTTVLVAGGLAKVPAILGALRGGYINTLITDEVTASKLLESHGASPS